MSDLISKKFTQEALIERISRLNAEGATQAAKELIRFNRLLDGLTPSADRPTGEWIYLHGSIGSYMTISCPFCGETFNDVAEWNITTAPTAERR